MIISLEKQLKYLWYLFIFLYIYPSIYLLSIYFILCLYNLVLLFYIIFIKKKENSVDFCYQIQEERIFV